MTDWRDVGRALLGSWPSQVASWGREAIAAYCAELQARGLTPDAALRAIRSADAGPAPTAPSLAKLAHIDPEQPATAELVSLIYGPGGAMRARTPPGASYESEAQMLSARDEARLERAWDIHPLLGLFVDSYGVRRLAMLEVDHDEYGAKRRRELEEAWEGFCERNAHRDRAALAAGRKRELGRGPRRLDPVRAIAKGEDS